ncbi:hypothetical protein [Coprobacter sp.]
MEIDLFTYGCSGCGKCVGNCPCGALIIRDNGFCRFVNVVDENLCSGRATEEDAEDILQDVFLRFV